MNEWDAYGLRHGLRMSGRTRPDPDNPRFAALSAMAEPAREPLRGLTADGDLRTGLFALEPTGVPTAPITEAALQLLSILDAEARQRLVFPLDAPERRIWFNIHPNVFRHGLLLEDLSSEARQAALAVMEATLSARGYQQARDIMRINGLLVDLTGRADEFGEWPYWFSLFGSPSADEPWSWQIDGHHLNVNCTVLGDQLILTPTFMGSEPCHITSGPLAGTEVLVPEERAGLDLIRALDDGQLDKAVLRPSIAPGDLPPELQHPIDGRMVAGAFKDNAVVGYEGLRADAMTDGQRRLLQRLIGTFVGWGRDGHAALHLDDVTAHLDETHFCWMGTQRDDGPFYYRVQSPAVLIEFDHHPGIVFDNDMPSRVHIHSILRTPNGGDYGADLLRQHHERFDHSTGEHRPHADEG